MEQPGRAGGSPSDRLGARDGQALARLLREHTTTPHRCWFGIWDGYCWDAQIAAFTPCGTTGNYASDLIDPVPAKVHAGQRLSLPRRDYLLYTGPVEAGLAFVPEQGQLADLWWPTDRAWFVSSDVDLNVTYVAGTAELIETIVACEDLEALVANPDDWVVTGPDSFPGWLTDLVEKAVFELLNDHRAELTTSRFTASIELKP